MSNGAPRTRDEDEFESFFHTEFNPTVRRLMSRERRLTQADAEDIVSIGFQETHKNWAALRDPGGFLWHRVLLRTVDFWRKQQARRCEFLTDFSDKTITPSASREEEPDGCIDVHHLHELIGKLSVEDQGIIAMSYGGATRAEQARALGISEATARVRLHRARRRLERLLNGEGEAR